MGALGRSLLGAAERRPASHGRDGRKRTGEAAPDALAQVTVLYLQGRHRDALHAATAALQREPANSKLWNVSAGAAYALGLREDAERFWNVAVARDPDYAEPHYNLGVLYFERGNLDAAAGNLARAVVLEPSNPRALNNLGAVLAELSRFDEAVTLLRRSVALDSRNPQAFHNLGLSLMELGQFAEARASLERAIALKPDFAEALTSIATLCLQEGDDEPAERVLDAALAIDPCSGTAHLRRALQRRVTASPWLDQLRVAHRQRGSRSGRDAIDLNFAAGKAFEDLGEYDAAFEAYAEGNRLQYARHPYDDARNEAFVERMISDFDADLYTQDCPSGSALTAQADEHLPVFVVGMPRSGTSLVEQILASHPEVFGAGELRTLNEILALLPRGVPPRTDCGAWLARLRELGGQYLARIGKPEVGARWVVDKMPSNYHYLGLVPLMIPGARIIHVTRDPMDVCFSCFATPFAHGQEYSFDQRALGRHYLRYRRLMDHWRRVLPPGHLLEVSYEALVVDMERETRRLLNYLGLRWDERCSRFHENRRVSRTFSRVQVREPIYTRSIARWKRFERHLEPLRETLAPILNAHVTQSTLFSASTEAIQVPVARTDIEA